MSTLVMLALIAGFCIPAGIAWFISANSLRRLSDAMLEKAYNDAETAFNRRISFVLEHFGTRYQPDSYDRSLLIERNKYRDEIERREAKRG